MKVLTFSTLYPNSAQPAHGVFVEQRLLRLVASGRIEARVVAPVPWFPSSHPRFGRYATFARAPRSEIRNRISVLHPRYPLPPAIGMSAAPLLMAWAARNLLHGLRAGGFRFDVIDAHYLYPDGVAAALLGRWLGVPVVQTARGSDVNVLSRYAFPRRWIRWALRRSAATITVSTALANGIRREIDPGLAPRVIPNGVDLEVFKPLDREQARRSLGLRGKTLLLVGKLTAPKGQQIAIESLKELPDCELLLVGEGPDEGALRRLAETAGVAARVRFLGTIDHAQLPAWYCAADVTVLPSEREGMPNSVLESLACGTPVIATRVGGVPEVMTDPVAGELLGERTPRALVDAVRRLLSAAIDRPRVRDYARRFDWSVSTAALLEVFSQVRNQTAGERA